MPTAADLVAYEDDLFAQGIHEEPPGSNHTIIGERFGFDRVAWCAETQSVATADVFGRRIFWSASVAEWINAAAGGVEGMKLLPGDAWIEAGMLVTYDFGGRGNPANFHIAMVRDPGTQAKFQTDGGNEGDAMCQQWRDRRYVTHFIRLPFDAAQEDDLTDKQAQMLEALFAAIKTPGNGIEDRMARVEACLAPADKDHADAHAVDVQLKEIRKAVRKP